MARSKYSAEVKSRMLAAYDDGKDWSALASLFGVKTKTMESWIRRHEAQETVFQHGGARHQKINEHDVDAMVAWLSECSTLTLGEIQRRLRLEHNKDVSKSTISRHLDGRLITLKKIRCIAETMNSWENKQKRKT